MQRSWTFLSVAVSCLLGAAVLAACGDDDETEPGGTTGTGTTAGGTGGTGGSGGSGGTGQGGSTGGADPTPFDLQNGAWQLTNASNTVGTISHDGAIGITDSGTLWVAFAEPDSVDTTDQDIFTASRSGADFAPATPLTNDDAVQNAFPSMAADGDALHLVWSGYPGGDNDIFYASHSGSWSTPVDLTTAFEAGTDADWHPSIAVAPGGDAVVAYLSAAQEQDPPEVKVIRIAGGTAAGAPVTALPVVGAGCQDPRVALDGAGHVHVVAYCGPLFDERVYYATDASGSWVSDELTPGASDVQLGPAIAVGPDGSSIHVAWQGEQACAAGTCSEIFYVSRDGGTFSNPVSASNTPEDDESTPVLAVDRWGRPIVSYHRFNASGYADIFVANSQDGSSFGPEVNVTPGTDDDDEWIPYDLILHPHSGLPHLTFTQIVGGDPLNTEVIHAEFVPAG